MAFPSYWNKLYNGINVERSDIPSITDSEISYLASAGVKHVRVFVQIDEGFTWPTTLNMGSFGTTWAFFDKLKAAGIACMLAIRTNTVSSVGPVTQTIIRTRLATVAGWCRQFAEYLKSRYGEEWAFLDIYNEPFLNSSDEWWGYAQTILNEIRRTTADFTVIVQGNNADQINGVWNWDFIAPLVNKEPLVDASAKTVYAFHYYREMNFSHQGLTWAGYGNIVNRHYYSDGSPGSEGGLSQSKIYADMARVGLWSQTKGVFVIMNEGGITKPTGSYSTPLPSEKGDWLRDVRQGLELYSLGWTFWDYAKGFSLTQGSAGSRTFVNDFARGMALGSYYDGVPTLPGGTPSEPPPTPPEPTVYTYTPAHTVAAQTIDGPFNNDVSGGYQDQVNLTQIFDDLGGDYNDPDTGLAARIAAVAQAFADYDSDGAIDDVRITVDGLDDFSVTVKNLTVVPTTAQEPVIADLAIKPNNTPSTTAQVTIPPGGQVGSDSLYAIIGVRNGATVSTPAGWSLDHSFVTTGLYVNFSVYVFKRTLDIGDAGSTVGFTVSAAQASIAACIRVAGDSASQARVYAHAQTAYNGSSHAATVPDVSVAKDKSALLRIVIAETNSIIPNSGPTDATLLYAGWADSNYANALLGIGIAKQSKDEGSAGTDSWPVNFLGNGIVLSMAIAPASTASPTDLKVGSVVDTDTVIVVDPIPESAPPTITASSTVYPKYKEALLDALDGVDLHDGIVKVQLLDLDEYTYSASDEFLDDIPSAALVGPTVTLTGKSITNGVFDANNVTFPNVSGNPSEAVLIYLDSGSDSTSRLVSIITFNGVSVPANGNDIHLNWSDGPEKIFKI